MKKTTTLALIILFSITAYSQTVAVLMQQGKALEKQRKETKALFKYKTALTKAPNNYDVLLAVSWLSSRVGYRIADLGKRKEYFNAALMYAEKVYAMKPNDADANYILCLAIGRVAQISSSKKRIEMTKKLEKHGQKALSIDPNHAQANHILGLLYYRLANLSAVEKAAANLVLGGIPKSSNAKALTYLVRAVKGDPSYILYRRELAFCLVKMKEKEKAKTQLRKAISLPIRTEDDPGYIRTCKAILSKLK